MKRSGKTKTIDDQEKTAPRKPPDWGRPGLLAVQGVENSVPGADTWVPPLLILLSLSTSSLLASLISYDFKTHSEPNHFSNLHCYHSTPTHYQLIPRQHQELPHLHFQFSMLHPHPSFLHTAETFITCQKRTAIGLLSVSPPKIR